MYNEVVRIIKIEEAPAGLTQFDGHVTGMTNLVWRGANQSDDVSDARRFIASVGPSINL